MSWFAVLCRYVSRDRNIVQFYGACVQTNSLLLVIELMEVRVDTHDTGLLLLHAGSAVSAGPGCRRSSCGCSGSLPVAVLQCHRP